jgi:hypothetical protein
MFLLVSGREGEHIGADAGDLLDHLQVGQLPLLQDPQDGLVVEPVVDEDLLLGVQEQRAARPGTLVGRPRPAAQVHHAHQLLGKVLCGVVLVQVELPAETLARAELAGEEDVPGRVHHVQGRLEMRHQLR